MLSLLTLWDTNFWPTQQPASINQDCTLCNTLSTYILRATCWSTLEQQASKHHRNDRNFEHVTEIKPLPFSIRRLIIPSVRGERSCDWETITQMMMTKDFSFSFLFFFQINIDWIDQWIWIYLLSFDG